MNITTGLFQNRIAKFIIATILSFMDIFKFYDTFV